MALIKTVRGKTPVLGQDCFIADNATIVGDVEIGDQCSIWFNTVIRADVNYIRIGERTNIQDGAVIHCTYEKAPTVIGNEVSVAHNAIVHGCVIKDKVLIGMGSIIMDHAVVESGSVVAAGAVVPSGMKIEADFVYGGIPARKIKKVDEEMKNKFSQTAKNYLMYAKWY